MQSALTKVAQNGQFSWVRYIMDLSKSFFDFPKFRFMLCQKWVLWLNLPLIFSKESICYQLCTHKYFHKPSERKRTISELSICLQSRDISVQFWILTFEPPCRFKQNMPKGEGRPFGSLPPPFSAHFQPHSIRQNLPWATALEHVYPHALPQLVNNSSFLHRKWNSLYNPT